jgi:hypothetical protein
MARDLGSVGSFGLLGTNSSGQVPVLPRDLVDATTPDDVKSRKGQDGEDYVLVFSDEFTSDGRTCALLVAGLGRLADASQSGRETIHIGRRPTFIMWV